MLCNEADGEAVKDEKRRGDRQTAEGYTGRQWRGYRWEREETLSTNGGTETGRNGRHGKWKKVKSLYSFFVKCWVVKKHNF